MWCKISSTMSWSRQGGRSFETKLRFQKDAQQETINIIVYPTYVSFCFMKYMYFYLYIIYCRDRIILSYQTWGGDEMHCCRPIRIAPGKESHRVIEHGANTNCFPVISVLAIFPLTQNLTNSKSHLISARTSRSSA